MTEFVIIRPWRGGDPQRERSRKYADRWWRKLGYRIVEVEHPGPEPFSRSWALNEGARRAWPWDVALFIDTDVVEDHENQVHDALRAAQNTGRIVVAHTSGKDLNERGTELLYRGKAFDWNRYLAGHRKICDSRANAIRADLFEEIGGFDERFRGWGHEDVALFAAAETLRGKAVRVPGCSWHLWHEPMLGKSKRTREWVRGRDLADRYLTARARGKTAMRRFLTERSQLWTPPETRPDVDAELVVLTSGRRTYLRETLASFETSVLGNFVRRTIVDDSGDSKHTAWLRDTFPGYDVVAHDRNLGFTESVAHGWRLVAERRGPPYVFWLEDDFVFERPVRVADLAAILEERPELAQVALLRAPFYGPELRAGSIPKQHPRAYAKREAAGQEYLEHTRYFTTNPHLMPRKIAATGWETSKSSEVATTERLVRDGYLFALLGSGEPWVRHIGKVRKGGGY